MWSLWKLWWKYQERFYHPTKRSCHGCHRVWKQLASVYWMSKCEHNRKRLQSVLAQESVGAKTLWHHQKWRVCSLPFQGKIMTKAHIFTWRCILEFMTYLLWHLLLSCRWIPKAIMMLVWETHVPAIQEETVNVSAQQLQPTLQPAMSLESV